MLHAIEINVSLNMVFFSVDAFSGTQTRERVSLPELQRSVVLRGVNRDTDAVAMAMLISPPHTPALFGTTDRFSHTSVEDAGLVILNSLFEGQTSSKIKGVENTMLTFWRRRQKAVQNFSFCPSLKASPNKTVQ